MSSEVFTLGLPTAEETYLALWEGNYGQIPASLVAGEDPAFLRRFRIRYISIFGEVQFYVATTGEGGDPSADDPQMMQGWEEYASAITLAAGSLSITIPGPGWGDNVYADTEEAYFWYTPASLVEELTDFIDAYVLLSDEEKAGTTLTLDDGVAQTGTRIQSTGSAGAMQITARLRKTNIRKRIRATGSAGAMQITARLRKTGIRKRIRATGSAGAMQITARLRKTNIRKRIQSSGSAGAVQITTRIRTTSILKRIQSTGSAGAMQITTRIRSHEINAIAVARAETFGLTGRRPVYALEISHPDVTDNIRVVNDTEAIMIEGEFYNPVEFRERLPQDKEHEIRRAEIEIDNVGRHLITWVERSKGGRGATMRVMQIVKVGGVAEIVWEIPSFDVGNSYVDNQVFRLRLVDESVTQAPAVKLRHDPHESPGLF